MRAHIIENGKIVNTIEVESLDFLPNLVDASLGGAIGDLWDGQRAMPAPKYATLADTQAARKADVAQRRYEKETGGVSVAGVVVRTDRESQAMLTGAKSFSDVNPDALIDWKTADGWAKIDRATLTSIAQAVGAHVQACFSNERVHHEAIDALSTSADMEAYDISTGWPG